MHSRCLECTRSCALCGGVMAAAVLSLSACHAMRNGWADYSRPANEQTKPDSNSWQVAAQDWEAAPARSCGPVTE